MIQLERLPATSSLPERAHRTIKRYILEGNFDSESRLTEDFFAQRLGISKSPVREALNTLQSEGLRASNRAKARIFAAIAPRKSKIFTNCVRRLRFSRQEP